MVASVLHQLALQSALVFQALEAMYNQHIHRGSLPLISELSDYLHTASRTFKRIFVVVDALDEYSQDSLDDVLQNLQSMSPAACYFLTSRPNIQLALKNIVHLKIHAYTADREEYLVNRMENTKTLCNLTRKDTTLKAQVVKTIVEKAKGM